ncbi:VAMP-associated protein [Rhizopus microsporus var. microsporus]|uniref:VAMP-associated protein n=2 Tax=Rhizopus microsporus TaxID=58291 RepID=A0A2G4T4C0_RHIZD|nr:VAMP-associated protein [Rhizopus microsporus ATCC 52813]ORE01963.1 VAMP-associated protein [Rhizopus microsporus var. microsporus]PHZ15862.1 VAMP-associated protein [Rhizopus microsporus ATCC 52813]
MSVRIEPSEQLLFHRPFTRISKESLFVKNTNDFPVIFKVKTTAPKQYCVRPNAGRIEPNSEIEVQIILQPFKEELPDDYKCKDKFLVQTAPLNPSLEQQDITSMWSHIESSDKQSMHQHKIKCAFGGPKEEESASTEKSTMVTSEPSTNDKEVVNQETTPAVVPVHSDVISSPTLPVVPQTSSLSQPEATTTTTTTHNDTATTAPKLSIVPPPAPVQTTPAATTASEAVLTSPTTATTASATTAVEPQFDNKVQESEDKKQLKEALEKIKRLEKEIEELKRLQDEGMRARNNNQTVGGRKLASTVQPLDAVHQHLAQLERPRAVEGYPPQVLIGVAILVFLFTYLFF